MIHLRKKRRAKYCARKTERIEKKKELTDGINGNILFFQSFDDAQVSQTTSTTS
jgi:hypothetical protein